MCFIEPIVGRDWQGRSLSDSQHSYRSDVVFMRKQVCPWRRTIAVQREVQQRTVASVTQGAFRLYCFN